MTVPRPPVPPMTDARNRAAFARVALYFLARYCRRDPTAAYQRALHAIAEAPEGDRGYWHAALVQARAHASDG